jgi:hypothetical protein|tara:strand:- start:1667 stop:2308 length:642 start_codon:yes stop_codon:yes gene_type:complete
MAWTYTTLKSAIKDYLQNSETTFENNLANIIVQAENRILKSVQLPDFRKNSTGVMTSGNSYLTTPSDFMTPYSLALDNSGYEFLIFKDVNFIREAYPVSTTTATPKYYALFDDASFILGPTPNSNYTVELHYFYKPTSITTSADGTSWLGNNAETALLYGCLVEGYTFMKGEPDLFAAYQKQYEDALMKLKSLGEGYSTTDSYRSGGVRNQRV